MSFQFWNDAALTVAGVSNPVQQSDNSLAPVQEQKWLGRPDGNFLYRANSNPGVDNIVISVVSAGTGEPTTAVKLATTQAGLADAVAGASLTVGLSMLSGVANAFTFWAQYDDAVLVAGTYANLSLQTNAVQQQAQ